MTSGSVALDFDAAAGHDVRRIDERGVYAELVVVDGVRLAVHVSRT